MAEYIKISNLPLASDTAPGVELVGNNNGSTNRFPLSTLVDGTTVIADPTSGITLNPNNVIDKDELEEILRHKVDEDSYQEGLTVGNALQIISPDGITEEESFIFRTSAGAESISTGQAEIKSIKGNTVIWNQKNTRTGVITSSSNRVDGYYTLLNGTDLGMQTTGVWLFAFDPIEISESLEYFVVVGVKNGSYSEGRFSYAGGKYCAIISNFNIYQGHLLYIRAYDTENGKQYKINNLQVVNLTEMFGAGNEPTNIDEWNTRKPVIADEYVYNESEMINVHIEKLFTTGFNQLNSGTAKVLGGNQYQITGSYTSITLDGETITPSVDGLFTPAYNGILAVTGADNTTCVHLTWSGYRNGDFEPYEEHVISLPIDEIVDADGNQLFPNGLCSNGDIYDEVTATSATKRIDDDGSVLNVPVVVTFSVTPQSFGTRLNLLYSVNDFGTEEFVVPEGQQSAAVNHETFYMTNLRDKIRNIDGNTEAGALMNPSVDNLLAVLGNVVNGTFSKSWDVVNKCWQFSFVPNTSTQDMEGGSE